MIETMAFVDLLESAVCDHHGHILIQNFTVNHCASQHRHPEVWEAPGVLAALPEATDHCLCAPDALMALRRIDQWQWYVLYGIDLPGYLIPLPVFLPRHVVHGSRLRQLPFLPEFLVGFGQLGAKSSAESCLAKPIQ